MTKCIVCETQCGDNNYGVPTYTVVPLTKENVNAVQCTFGVLRNQVIGISLIKNPELHADFGEVAMTNDDWLGNALENEDPVRLLAGDGATFVDQDYWILDLDLARFADDRVVARFFVGSDGYTRVYDCYDQDRQTVWLPVAFFA